MTSRQEVYQRLKQLQKALRLTDGDTELMTAGAMPPEVKRNLKDLQLYEQVLLESMQRGFPLRESDRKELEILQQVLHLQDEEVQDIQHRIFAQFAPAEQIPGGSVNPALAHGETLASMDVANPDPALTTPPDAAVSAPLASTVISRPPGSPPPNLSGIKGQILKRAMEMEGMASPVATTPSPTDPVNIGGDPAVVPGAQLVPPSVAPAIAQPVQTVAQTPATEIQSVAPAAVSAPLDPEPPVKRSFLRRPEGILLLTLLLAMPIIWGLTWLLTHFFGKPQPASPVAAQLPLSRGIQKAQQKDFQGAVNEFSSAIKLDAKSTTAYINRGVAYHNLGKLGQASDDLDKAIALNPQSAEAYNNRSYVRLDQNRYDETINDAKRALELDPKLAEPYLNLGAALFAQNKIDEAAQNYDKAIQLRPNNPTLARAYNNRGNVFAAKSNLDQAIKDYDQATQLDAKYADAFYNRAIALERKKDKSAAVRGYKDAATLYKAQGNDDLSRKAQSQSDRLEKSPPAPVVSPAPGQKSV